MLLKVCQLFPQVGRISDCMALPAGELALYIEYAYMQIAEDARGMAFKTGGTGK